MRWSLLVVMSLSLSGRLCSAFTHSPLAQNCGNKARTNLKHNHWLSAAKRALVSHRNTPNGLTSVKCVAFAQPEFATFPQQMFTLVNFAVLPFWGMMIALPQSDATKKLMSSTVPIFLLAGIHLALVLFGVSQPGSAQEFQFLATQGFVKLSAMMEMRNYPVFVSEEWAHVLAWDLFVGRWIYLDGLKKDIPTPHSLFFCFLLGPLGLTMHLMTRAIVKKSLESLTSLD